MEAGLTGEVELVVRAVAVVALLELVGGPKVGSESGGEAPGQGLDRRLGLFRDERCVVGLGFSCGRA